MYSARLLDHFQTPRNVGELPEPSTVVQVENPVCGDILRLSVNVSDGILTQIRYKTRGCAASIAAGPDMSAPGSTSLQERNYFGASLIAIAPWFLSFPENAAPLLTFSVQVVLTSSRTREARHLLHAETYTGISSVYNTLVFTNTIAEQQRYWNKYKTQQ